LFYQHVHLLQRFPYIFSVAEQQLVDWQSASQQQGQAEGNVYRFDAMNCSLVTSSETQAPYLTLSTVHNMCYQWQRPNNDNTNNDNTYTKDNNINNNSSTALCGASIEMDSDRTESEVDMSEVLLALRNDELIKELLMDNEASLKRPRVEQALPQQQEYTPSSSLLAAHPNTHSNSANLHCMDSTAELNCSDSKRIKLSSTTI
jgi:hypothetical protein